MKKVVIVLGAILFLTAGCVGVRVKAPEKPFKVDIAMRLDVYQHVQNDIDAIENVVKGSRKEESKPIVQSFLDFLTPTAHAEGLDSAIEEAALRRNSRYSEIISLEKEGVLGESALGMIVIRKNADDSINKLVSEENSDRMMIYKGIAEKNRTSIENVQMMYGARLQNGAPAGTPVESSENEWHVK